MTSSQSKTIVLDINVGDQLTSISCGHVVVELIKFIVYQRLQIPYSYQWLKQIVTKRKMREETEIRESFQSQRHFRIASTALSNLDFILKSLLQEINSASIPEEVIISLGMSPISSKEVYRLILPTSCHKPQCRSASIANDQKIHRNVFKEIVTSDKLSQLFFNPLLPTNTYVFIKKRIVNPEVVPDQDHFMFTTGHRIPRSSKIIIIDFRSQVSGNSCCRDFKVFGDVVSQDLEQMKLDGESVDTDYHEVESTDSVKWYQSSYVMRGFKDCTINGTSVTSTWAES